MKDFAAIIEKDGDWYIAYCPEIPGANDQGRSIEECKQNLAAATFVSGGSARRRIAWRTRGCDPRRGKRRVKRQA